MTLRLNGDDGVSGVNGSSSTPAVQGNSPDSGIFFSSKATFISSNGNEVFKAHHQGFDITGGVASNVVSMTGNNIDCHQGNYFTKTVNGATTFTISNVPATGAFTIVLEVTLTSGTLTWPTEIKWSGDSVPQVTTGKTHVFVLVTDDGGARWRGAALVDYVN